MKLQRQLSRMVGETYYPKYTVVIPPSVVRKAGWKAGIELEVSVKGKRVTLKPTS